MGRTICLWLLVCLALGSAIPVPEPTSQEELREMILRAKPEDNAIDQPEDETKVPIVSSISEPQELVSQNEEEGNHELDQIQDPIVQSQANLEDENVKGDQELEPVPSVEIVPEEVGAQAQPMEPIPLIEGELITEEEKESPISEVEQDFYETVVDEESPPLPLEEEPMIFIGNEDVNSPVPENEQIFFDPAVEEVSPISDEQIFYDPAVDDENPIPDEQIIYDPAFEEEVPMPDLEQIISGPTFEEEIPMTDEEQIIDDPAFVGKIPITEEEQIIYESAVQEGPIPEEEQFFLTVDGQIIPVNNEDSVDIYEEQTFPIGDETEFQYGPEDTMIVNFENEEQMPNMEEPEGFWEVVGSELGQPIYEEPIIPGFVYEEPQSGEIEDSAEIGESIFGSFVPNIDFEEASQEEILPMHDETQGPVYFETFVDQESQSPEDFMEGPVENPIEQMPPFTISEIRENPFIYSEDFSSQVYPSEYAYEEDTHPDDESLEDYYISEEDEVSGEEFREIPETPFPGYENEAYMTGAMIPDIQYTQEDGAIFLDEPNLEVVHMLQSDSDESFISEDIDPQHDQTFKFRTLAEILANADASELALIETGLDSGEWLNDNLPFQNNGDYGSITDQENIPQVSDLKETIFIIEPQNFENDNEEPIIEIFPIVSQNPEDEPIVPIAEFIENDDANPIIIERDSYLLSGNPIPEPIIFPEEMAPNHNLPVYRHQWSEDNFFQPPTNGHIHVHDPAPSFGYPIEPSTLYNHPSESSYYSPLPFNGPSYGPPVPTRDSPYYNRLPYPITRFDPTNEKRLSNDSPQNSFMMEQHQTMIDMQNDDTFSQMPDMIMPQSEEPDVFMFDNEDIEFNEDYPHYHSSSEGYENSRFSNSPQEADHFDSYELPSLSEIAIQQDFHGPNTFPLNFRPSGFTPDFVNERFNPAKPRLTSQFINQGNPLENYAMSAQRFRGSNSPITTTPSRNMFLSMIGGEKMLIKPSGESKNMNLNVYENAALAMKAQNSNQRQQQYDVQVSFIPYESSFNFQTNDGPDPYRYPITQQPNSFNNYREFQYNFPSYEESVPYQSSGLYPSQPIQNRYSLDYDYRNPYAHYHTYNYPTPTW